MSKIYLAAPYFNDMERVSADKVYQCLKDLEIDVHFFAYDGLVLSPDSSLEDRKRAFSDNIREMDSCDVVVAIVESDPVYGIDCGTVFDLTYAWTKGKTVYTYDSQNPGKMNVMLAMASSGHASDISELIDVLRGNGKIWEGKVI